MEIPKLKIKEICVSLKTINTGVGIFSLKTTEEQNKIEEQADILNFLPCIWQQIRELMRIANLILQYSV